MTRLLTLALLASGCGLENSLSGSLGEVIPLEFSKVEVQQNAEAMQISYYRNRGVFLDVVLRVSVSLASVGESADGGVPSLNLKPGVKVALKGTAPTGVERCAVTHAPGGEPVRTLPRIKEGDIVITQGGRIGEVTKGNFSMLFETEGGDLGFGRTLSGTFSGTTSDAGFGELP